MRPPVCPLQMLAQFPVNLTAGNEKGNSLMKRHTKYGIENQRKIFQFSEREEDFERPLYYRNQMVKKMFS